jgi:lysozyme family protein
MEQNFTECLKFVLADEEGNDDDPADHGGRTSRGITQREYDAWRTERGQPHRDVWTADDGEIRDIYHDEYWLPICPSLPQSVDYLYFDLAVNGGPFRATITLQRALGVTDDGRIGPVTRAAIAAADPEKLIVDFSNAKRAFYRSLHQQRFLKGWLNRTASVQSRAESMLA